MLINLKISKARTLLNLLLKNQRQAENNQACAGIDCPHCQAPHLAKVLQAIEQQKTLRLILPAFPAKSANREKTISHFPDLAETMGLTNLNTLCQTIHEYHEAGIELLICSDGRVFNDLVLVSDKEVNVYQEGIRKIIATHQLSYLSTFSLDELYNKQNYQQMRDQLMAEYGEPLESLQQRLKTEQHLLYQFNGIHRFIVEDQLALKPGQSKNQVRRNSKKLSYEVVRRSNAWSKLLAARFPESLRLSIHPQVCGSEKLGIQFLPTTNRWATPWHNVLLKRADGWQLIKRIDAERLGARFNLDHYVLEASQ